MIEIMCEECGSVPATHIVEGEDLCNACKTLKIRELKRRKKHDDEED